MCDMWHQCGCTLHLHNIHCHPLGFRIRHCLHSVTLLAPGKLFSDLFEEYDMAGRTHSGTVWHPPLKPRSAGQPGPPASVSGATCAWECAGSAWQWQADVEWQTVTVTVTEASHQSTHNSTKQASTLASIFMSMMHGVHSVQCNAHTGWIRATFPPSTTRGQRGTCSSRLYKRGGWCFHSIR